MFKALVLVRNVESSAERIDFGEFVMHRIGLEYEERREVFSSADVNQGDWTLEKSYAELPRGLPGSPFGGIPNDVEDILFLLRLYKPGEISFIRVAVIQPSGRRSVQFPYRAINDLNSYSSPLFNARGDESLSWTAFAGSLRESRAWGSDWFSAARRFFLTGGAKQFNPQWDEVDRIVDYATALEATLVPEKEFNTRRVSLRSGALVAPGNLAKAQEIAALIRKFYEIRSRIVHGGGLGGENKKWLLENWGRVEARVRDVLKAAVQELPPHEDDRRAALAQLYDPSDEDRGQVALQKFKEIKTAGVRKVIADEIERLRQSERER
ncbi:MAG TPA: hypothetical protein VMH80_28760 [Bryobacteraceae bacterium]|nr:hypothetical protein [Bryobacteraceae bacterium]